MFITKDEQLSTDSAIYSVGSSLLSGSLSMALCCILYYDAIGYIFTSSDTVWKVFLLFHLTCSVDIQRIFQSGPLHQQPRVSVYSLSH